MMCFTARGFGGAPAMNNERTEGYVGKGEGWNISLGKAVCGSAEYMTDVKVKRVRSSRRRRGKRKDHEFRNFYVPQSLSL